MNTNPIGPIKSNPRDHVNGIDRERSLKVPRSDKNFKKVLDDIDADRKRQEELEQQEEAASIFDLAKKKAKPIATKSSTKEGKTPLSSLLAKEGVESDTELEQAIAFQQEIAKKKRFEMPSNSPDEEDMLAQQALKDATQAPDPLTQEQKIIRERKEYLALAAKQANLSRDTTDADATAFAPQEKPAKSQKSKEPSSAFAEERGDISSVNAANQAIFVDTRYLETKQEVTKVASLKELVDKIVETMQVIERQGIRETVVTLNNQTILNGAQIKLSAYETAPKEFNIAFSNLTNEARNLLDRQMMKDSLANALKMEGYVVHMITITAQTEVTPPTTQNESRFAREDMQEGQQPRQGQKQQRQS